MATPATPITYTLKNQGTTDIDIKNISYVDNINIQHHSDYSNFNYGGNDNTNDTSAEQYGKRYVTGDYLEKSFVSDTHARTVNYSTYTGFVLTIQDNVGHTTDGIRAGWAAAGTGFAGLYVQEVISTTELLLTGTPIADWGSVGQVITFSTSSIQITLTDTTGLAAGWSIINNGYNSGDNAVIVSVVGDNATLNVNVLPTNPTNNKMLFTSSTNYLTLNNTNNLDIDYTAIGNGYNGSQTILQVIDGSTVKMSGPPSSTPAANSEIKFTSNTSLYTIGSGESVTFTINYENLTSNVGSNYPSALTINAMQNSVPLVGNIDNFVNINSPPAPPFVFYDVINGDGSGGTRGGSLTSDTSPITVSYSISNEGMKQIGANIA